VFGGNLREEGDTEHLNIGFDTLFKPTYISYPSVDSQNNPVNPSSFKNTI